MSRHCEAEPYSEKSLPVLSNLHDTGVQCCALCTITARRRHEYMLEWQRGEGPYRCKSGHASNAVSCKVKDVSPCNHLRAEQLQSKNLAKPATHP